jgi:hypothetical protein
MKSKSQADDAAQFITLADFARITRLSRRHLDRLREARPAGFPIEYDFGLGTRRKLPRFKLREVQAWFESRALW